MKIVIFYEKPGCSTNARQKKILRQSGCIVIERDLLNNGLSKEELRSFFTNKPVREWFNPNAPQIKNGQVNPELLDELTALELMQRLPILIKRPLMVIGNRRLSGFEKTRIEALMDVTLVEEVPTECSASEQSCSKPTSKETMWHI